MYANYVQGFSVCLFVFKTINNIQQNLKQIRFKNELRSINLGQAIFLRVWSRAASNFSTNSDSECLENL